MTKSSVKSIPYELIDDLPSREDFIDPKLNTQLEDQIAKRDDIYFHPNMDNEVMQMINSGGEYAPEYQIQLFGIMPCGSRAMVIVEKIPVYFDVRVETWEDPDEFKISLRSKMQLSHINYKSMEIVLGTRLDEFTVEPNKWIRIHFVTMKDRHAALTYVHAMDVPGYEGDFDGYKEKRKTASDDDGYKLNYYYPKVARECALNTCGWNTLTGGHYVRIDNDDPKNIATNSKYVFRVQLEHYVPADYSKISNFAWANRDSTMAMTWDIETYTHGAKTGDAPKPEETNWDIFMICMTFHWYHTTNALLKICLVDVPLQLDESIFYDIDEIRTQSRKTLKKRLENAVVKIPGNDYSPEYKAKYEEYLNDCIDELKKKQSMYNYVVVCGTERNILKSFMRVIKRMAPELLISFNGGGFDWPCVREKLRREKLLVEFKSHVSAIKLNTWVNKTGATCGDTEPNIYKYTWQNERVKISADEMTSLMVLNVPGLIDTDCMIVFKQMYPKMETKNKFSLNYFLMRNKLGGKKDLPYKEMFRRYKQAIDIRDLNIEKVKERRNELRTEVEGKIIDKLLTLGKSPDEIAKTIESQLEIIVEKKMKLYLDTISDEVTAMQEHADKEMTLVGEYCVIDSFRCQQLYCKRTIVGDRREVANSSFVPLYAGIYRAGGMKVRHLVGHHSFHWNRPLHNKSEYPLMFSNAKPSNKKVKYPGAWVFPPKKGLNAKRPVVGLDFSSLYPSLMMCYNLSKECAIEDKPENAKFIQMLRDRGYYLRRIEFEATVTDENAPDCGSKVMVSGFAIRHSNVMQPGDKVDYVTADGECDRQGQDPLPGEIMGIFPTILRVLFADRKIFKKQFVALDVLLEQISNIIAAAEKIGAPVDYSELSDKDFKGTGFTRQQFLDAIENNIDIIEDIEFNCNKVNSKQKAKKVFMNTFYGEQGNSRSSIYKLLVAGGITSSGQYNIKKVNDLCLAMDYFVWYGDTDSCYISSPDRLFKILDEIFNDAEKYCNKRIAENNATSLTYKEISEESVNIVTHEVLQTHTNYRGDYLINEAKYKNGELDLEEFNTVNEASFKKYITDIMELADGLSSNCTDENKRGEIWKLIYYRAREEYWTMMVQVTRRDLTKLAAKVNMLLREDNGTGYLTMAYEEVLFPVVFTGKKKYFGFQHLEKENFHPRPEDIFIRGIDIIKTGQSEIAREIGMEIIEEVCSVFNDSEMLDLVNEKIKHIYSKQWELKHFVMNSKFKPAKRNVPVHTFVNRMTMQHQKYATEGTKWHNPVLASLYAPPEAGDPFKYIVVKREQSYDLRGRKIVMKKGDVMEYAEVYEYSQKTNDPLEIDLNYYMKGAIIGLLARFITYRPEFQPTEDVVDEDKFSVDKARKYIMNICDDLSGIDRDQLRVVGRSYQKITKEVEASIRNRIVEKYGDGVDNVINYMQIPTVEHSDNYKLAKETAAAAHATADAAIAYAQSLVDFTADRYDEGKKFMLAMKPKIKETPGLFNDLKSRYMINMVGKNHDRIDPESRIGKLDTKINAQIDMISKISSTILNIVQQHRFYVNDLIMDARQDEESLIDERIDNAVQFTSNEQIVISSYYDMILDLAGLLDCRHTLMGIHYVIVDIENRRRRISGKPSTIPNFDGKVKQINVTFDKIPDGIFD